MIFVYDCQFDFMIWYISQQFKMNYKLEGKEKQYYKNKVSDIMQSYQKQQEEQNKKKQNIKKQIMLSIMQNRQKHNNQAQPPKSTQSKPLQLTFKPHQSNNNLMPNYKSGQQQQTLKQMKMDDKINKSQFQVKSNKSSLDNNKSYKELYEEKIQYNQINDRKIGSKDIKNNQNRSNLNRISPLVQDQYQDEQYDYEEYKFVIENNLSNNLSNNLNKIKEFTFKAQNNKNILQDSNFKASHLNKLKQQRIKEEQEYKQKIDNHSKYSKKEDKNRKLEFKVENQEQNLSEEYEQQVPFDRSTNNKIGNQSNSYTNVNRSNQNHQNISSMPRSKVVEKEENKEDQQNQQQENKRGVFLTMEQSESMVASQGPKNYAFQIKNDEGEDFEQLKKQKIRDIERKRQQRIQQFRRNQSSKKVQIPRGRSNLMKRHDKSIQKKEIPPNESDNYRKNPSNNEISSKPFKIQPKNQSKHDKQAIKGNKNMDKQFDYNLKNVPVKPVPNNSSNYDPYAIKPSNSYQYIYQEKQPRAISPHRTPKTVLSQNRNKSQNKNVNIFQNENQNIRQKSANKVITEPKIQPKDRKNSFTKQSNKKLMINAITYVIFPGELNRKQRQKLIEVLQHSEYEFFIFLFKEYSRKMIKGIYVLDASQKKLERIYGDKAPYQITAEKVQQFYRFDSGSRQFKKVDGCKSFSLSIHAIDAK